MNRCTKNIVLSAFLLSIGVAVAGEVSGPGASGSDWKSELVMPDPRPKPKDLWNSIMAEEPVRLEGASFASGSAILLHSADDKLNQVVDVARQHPDLKLEVSGHTDDTGSAAANQKLSEDRAAAVKAYLVRQGISASRIIAAGYAGTQPLTDNKTEIGRAANRRVEVRYEVMDDVKIRAIK